MLRKAIGCGIVAILKRIREGVTSGEHHVLIQLEIHSRSHEHLLPLQTEVVTPPLALKMNFPPFTDRMVTEIAIPGVQVRG
jgi:hypothetical protein